MISGDTANTEIHARLAQFRVLFVKRLRTDIERLNQLAEEPAPIGGENGRASIQKIAHSIAGAAGTFGFPEISECAAGLEDRICSGDDDSTVVALTRQTIETISSILSRGHFEAERSTPIASGD